MFLADMNKLFVKSSSPHPTLCRGYRLRRELTPFRGSLIALHHCWVPEHRTSCRCQSIRTRVGAYL